MKATLNSRHLCGGCILVLLALAPALGAREVMSWVPPYGMEDAKTVLQSSFGDFSPSNALTRLGLQFWVPTETGDVVKAPEYGTISDSDIAWFRNWGNGNGTEILLCIYNNVGGAWDWDLAVSAFGDHRSAFVSNLVATMTTYDLDGIDVDLEGIVTPTASHRLAFKLFLEELSAELKSAGKVLTVDTFHSPVFYVPNMSWWSDWSNLVDTVHSMGYTDLYEGSTATLDGVDGYPFRYSWQQDYGVGVAGLAPDAISMGLPSETADWGSNGRGSNVLNHIYECIYDCAVPASISIWDIQLWGTATATNWRSSEVWGVLTKLSNYEALPVDRDGDNMADTWEITHFGGTNAVGGGHGEDKDNDRYSNLQEYIAGTDPTNRSSLLRVDIHGDGSSNVVVHHSAYRVDPFDIHYGDLRRFCWLEHTSNLLNDAWGTVSGSTAVVTSDKLFFYTNAMPGDADCYRVGIGLR